MVKNVNAIDASGLKKTGYDNKASEIEVSINYVKAHSITGLPTTAALNAVKNKIPNVSDLVKKINYNAKTKDIKIKCFKTSNYNKFTKEILAAKIKNKGNLIFLIFRLSFTSNHSLCPNLISMNNLRIRVRLKVSCLKKTK